MKNGKYGIKNQIKNQIKKYARCESEPATFIFAVWCSTDWANHTAAVDSQIHVP